MLTTEYAEFEASLRQAGEIFSKPVTEAIVKNYWEALRDQPLPEVGKRIWRHIRHGKFFPKPYELRPKDDKPKQDERHDPVWEQGARDTIARWDEWLKDDPLAGKWALLDAYIGRTQIQFHRGHIFYAERMEWSREVLRRLMEQCDFAFIAAKEYRLRVVDDLLGIHAALNIRREGTKILGERDAAVKGQAA